MYAEPSILFKFYFPTHTSTFIDVCPSFSQLFNCWPLY